MTGNFIGYVSIVICLIEIGTVISPNGVDLNVMTYKVFWLVLSLAFLIPVVGVWIEIRRLRKLLEAS